MSEENTARDLDDATESESTDTGDQPADGVADHADSGAGAASEVSANEATNQEVQSVVPPDMNAGAVATGPGADISMILDIPVTMSMEIGQTRISINELLKLGKDSVIELQRMADEPMDVLVNGTLVAHGEAVVVGDRFGIRLTDVISPQERLRKFT